jgi:hypothetical protein
MSAAHMGMVFAAEGLDGSEKLLLLALTNYTDPHGYCWPSEQRLADDCGTSRSTVQRTKRKLAARSLVKSVRRVNPKTGEPISNLTRVNLPLLASLSRSRTGYDDDLIDRITFDDDSQGDPASTLSGTPDDPCTPDDLLKGQSDSHPESNRSRPGINVTPTPGQDDAQSLTDPVEDPSPLPPVADPAAAVVPHQGVGEDTSTADDPATAFVDSLPYRGQVPNRSTRERLIARARDAYAAGWTPRALHRQLTNDTQSVQSLPGVYLHRLAQLPDPAAVAASVAADATYTPPTYQAQPAPDAVPPNRALAAARAALRAQRDANARGRDHVPYVPAN